MVDSYNFFRTHKLSSPNTIPL